MTVGDIDCTHDTPGCFRGLRQGWRRGERGKQSSIVPPFATSATLITRRRPAATASYREIAPRREPSAQLRISPSLSRVLSELFAAASTSSPTTSGIAPRSFLRFPYTLDLAVASLKTYRPVVDRVNIREMRYKNSPPPTRHLFKENYFFCNLLE